MLLKFQMRKSGQVSMFEAVGRVIMTDPLNEGAAGVVLRNPRVRNFPQHEYRERPHDFAVVLREQIDPTVPPQSRVVVMPQFRRQP